MQRKIIGFHQDGERHWVAALDCGHGQHVRHDPPWQLRAWVVDEASRRGHLGSVLDCLRCDEPEADDLADAPRGLSPAAARAYRDARMLGLCEAGALEAAPAARPIEPAGRTASEDGDDDHRRAKETRHVE